jgi:uncharacterized protein YbjQ (UPF0145 family)
MPNSKEILVVTTSSVDGLKIQQYIKPVSAHIVAGTNLFSDFLGSITDVFGGRSKTYQKQLNSLYQEAIERIKVAAFEVGGNCVVGLKIDMDEISGKGKSMFMLSAVGTAVIVDKPVADKATLLNNIEKLDHIGVDRINVLRQKKAILEKAATDSLTLTDDIWDFVTANQVDEIFPFLLKRYSYIFINDPMNHEAIDKFYQQLTNYVDVLPETKKLDLVYNSLNNQHERVASKLTKIIKELNLFDYGNIMDLLRSENFQGAKYGIKISTYDQSFYNKADLNHLKKLKEFISDNFKERGTRSTKKQLLSSKEKDSRWKTFMQKILKLQDMLRLVTNHLTNQSLCVMV